MLSASPRPPAKPPHTDISVCGGFFAHLTPPYFLNPSAAGILESMNRRPAALALAAATAAALTVVPSAAAAPQLADLKTKCRNVNWVGDSTSIAMIEEGSGTVTPGNNDLATKPLSKALFATGVESITYDISGGRSAIEKINNKPSAVEALEALMKSNPKADCNVAAIGTNDAANIEVGSNYGAAERLTRLLKVSGKTPLLVTTAAISDSATASGYTSATTKEWNDVIRRLPASNVIDWAEHVKDEYFYPDGIHFNEDGTFARSELAARVMAADRSVRSKSASSKSPGKKRSSTAS